MRALPIDEHLPEIVRALREVGGLVLVAEPGAGKTTRVPRALLDAGFADEGSVLVLEPRRIAARTAAARIAEELGEPLGERIGYRVRFEQRVSRRTRVELVTEGIFARRLNDDPSLEGVSVVVFDELHERQLGVDLGLARVRALQRGSRPDLGVVAMSATLEAAPIADFLAAPIIEVPGRVFPVSIVYDERPDTRPLERRVRAALVRALDAEAEGDVLVFLPGVAEIRRALEACSGPAEAFGVDLLPLYGELPPAAQDRAIRPGPRRKVVLATNVAETSLTLEGVTTIIDSGLARVPHVSPWTGLSRLEVAPISQASATQRAGRAGRTRPGTAFRLYTRADHDRRPARERPEIQRADLAELALSLYAAGQDPRAFPFFEAPPAPALDAADALLERLGAVRGARVTEIGRSLLSLPAHPRVGRVAIEAARRGHLALGAAAAALLAERDVRGRGARPSRVEVVSSDVGARLAALERVGARASSSSLRAEGLDPGAVASWRRAAEQLSRALERRRVKVDAPTFDEDEALALALLAGFSDRVAARRHPGGRTLVLAAGGQAEQREESGVLEASLLVTLDAEVRAGKVLVGMASAIEAEHLLELFPEGIEDAREVYFDPETERVRAKTQLRFGAIVLDEGRAEPSDAEAAEVLAQAALAAGVGRLCDLNALEALRRRLDFARRVDPSLPALDEPGLEALLVGLCEGRRSFAELADADLIAHARHTIGHRALERLDRLAPAHVAIGRRRRVEVNYEVDRPPWVASRLQDFFGMTEGPRVADAEHLVLHLLAPNGRAVQVTTDLAGFWERHYPSIRKELMRRYPRHPWPEDPLTASPPEPRGRRR